MEGPAPPPHSTCSGGTCPGRPTVGQPRSTSRLEGVPVPPHGTSACWRRSLTSMKRGESGGFWAWAGMGGVRIRWKVLGKVAMVGVAGLVALQLLPPLLKPPEPPPLAADVGLPPIGVRPGSEPAPGEARQVGTDPPGALRPRERRLAAPRSLKMPGKPTQPRRRERRPRHKPRDQQRPTSPAPVPAPVVRAPGPSPAPSPEPAASPAPTPAPEPAPAPAPEDGSLEFTPH